MSFEYQEKNAAFKGRLLGCQYLIVPFRGRYNGYAVFPERPLVNPGYDGILVYVPVHGGITFYEEAGGNDKRVCYGFDTHHYDSEKYPVTEPWWIRNEIRWMIRGIRRAAQAEKAYNMLPEDAVEDRTKLAQKVWGTRTAGKDLNFGMMLRMLSGRP